DRLAADHALGWHGGLGPGQAAIGRVGHVQGAAAAAVVILDIAVAVEWAGRGVVADDPVLVEILRTGDGAHRDGVAPGEPAIRGAVDHDGRADDRCAAR